MTDSNSIHVFWIRPLPGIDDVARVIVAADNADQTSLVLVLPDNTQVIVTADRAVFIRGEQMLTLGQWQYAPVCAAEYQQEAEPAALPDEEAPAPEIPERGYGQPRDWPGQALYTQVWEESTGDRRRAPWPHSSSMAPPPPHR